MFEERIAAKAALPAFDEVYSGSRVIGDNKTKSPTLLQIQNHIALYSLFEGISWFGGHRDSTNSSPVQQLTILGDKIDIFRYIANNVKERIVCVAFFWLSDITSAHGECIRDILKNVEKVIFCGCADNGLHHILKHCLNMKSVTAYGFSINHWPEQPIAKLEQLTLMDEDQCVDGLKRCLQQNRQIKTLSTLIPAVPLLKTIETTPVQLNTIKFWVQSFEMTSTLRKQLNTLYAQQRFNQLTLIFQTRAEFSECINELQQINCLTGIAIADDAPPKKWDKDAPKTMGNPAFHGFINDLTKLAHLKELVIQQPDYMYFDDRVISKVKLLTNLETLYIRKDCIFAAKCFVSNLPKLKTLVMGSNVSVLTKQFFRDCINRRQQLSNPQKLTIYLEKRPFEKIKFKARHHNSRLVEIKEFNRTVSHSADLLASQHTELQISDLLKIF